MAKKKEFTLSKKLDHIAFIMDGNGRWANLRGLPRHIGHHEACKRMREIFDVCMELGIKCASVYAFSTENWSRPQDEIDHLMDYLEEFFNNEIDYFVSKGTRIMISGDYSRLREQTKKVCDMAIERTKDNDTFIVNVCLNYGSRDEIAKACRELCLEVKEGRLGIDEITPEVISNHLYTAGLSDVDLMIRTSGEQRLSNFLLFQNAYAEFVFTPVKWPDFHKKELIECIKEYESRSRRYGGLKNE